MLGLEKHAGHMIQERGNHCELYLPTQSQDKQCLVWKSMLVTWCRKEGITGELYLPTQSLDKNVWFGKACWW